MNLEKLLNGVGKQVFVKYYYYFKDSKNYPNSKMLSIINEDYTDKSKCSRTGHARMIFNNGLNIKALENIINSNIPNQAIIECKKILEQELKNNNSETLTINKNKLSNDFLKKFLRDNKIHFIERVNSFYEVTLANCSFLFKCRTYNNNYTFVAKSEIPILSEKIIIALVEWQNDNPVNLYLIPTSEWQNGKWEILKERNYEGLPSRPEWGIDITKSNKYELYNFIADKFLEKIKEEENKKYIEEIEKQENKEVEKQALIKVRLGHSSLRDKIITQKKECEICGIKNNKLLIASHIKPWAKSNNTEKLDSDNILLLCSMHDALFDKGLISFDDCGKIIISSELDDKEQALVNINKDTCINISSEKQKKYLKFHRENIFIY